MPPQRAAFVMCEKHNITYLCQFIISLLKCYWGIKHTLQTVKSNVGAPHYLYKYSKKRNKAAM